MTIPTKTFSQLVSDMVASYGGNLGINPSLQPGSFVLALFEAVASQLDFLQAVAASITNLSRAATSVGSDLDSWMAQFNFARLPATYAQGPVVLGKNTPASTVINVPAATLVSGVYVGGGLVQTTGGSVVYQLIPDTGQAAYNSSTNTYQFAVSSTSITATAQALVAGSAYNVVAGALTQLGSTMAGVDTVNNTVPIQNGVAAEADASYRSRFVLYLSNLAEGTQSAILAAANSVQQGLQISTQENTLAGGGTLYGSFTVFVDNGTGSPGSTLLSQVLAAVNAVRAFSVQPFVVGPTITTATIVLSVRLAAGYTLVGVGPLVQTAISAVVNQLYTNTTLFVSAVEAAALSVAGVVAVQPGTTINGSAADLVPATSHEIRTNSGVITVGTY